MYYLISQSHFIHQFHKFNSVTNSTVLSRFTFSSISKVYKFTCLIWFHSLISFNSPTYSKVSQIQLSYLVYIISDSTVSYIQPCDKFNILIFFTLYLIQQFHVLKVQQSQWSYLDLHSHLFHKCNKFIFLIWFTSLISLNSPTYQIQQSYLIQQCNLIQQFQIFNQLKN